MKRTLISSAAAVALLASPGAAWATTFFSDTFSGGSVVNATTNFIPTSTSASYQILSAKSQTPTPSIAGRLKYGIAASTSGAIEMQSLFTTNPVALVAAGDYVQLSIMFTNTAGILSQAGSWGFGLYFSGNLPGNYPANAVPVLGGLNGTAVNSSSTAATGGVQNWKGYMAQISYGTASSGFYDRTNQTGSDNRNQDLVTTGSGSQSYGNPGGKVVGTASSTPSVTLTVGNQYTEVLTFAMTSSNTLVLDSRLYNGTDTNATPVSTMTATTTTGTTATSFDGLALGWRSTGNTASTIDIGSITVSGQSTTVTAPPDINTQPVSMSSAPGSLAYFQVAASGYSMTYQWHRGGTNLVNSTNISGATAPTLVISPVTAADYSSTYYVTVNGAGGYFTNSSVVSLTSRTAQNLVWQGNAGANWDLGTTANWTANGGTSSTSFGQGDNVVFDDSGANTTLSVIGSYLSPLSIFMSNNSTQYRFQGSGNIAGPAKMNILGAERVIFDSPNTYTGGTIISNSSSIVVMNNQSGLGTGPVTFAQAGAQMLLLTSGGAGIGLGSLVIQDNATIYASTNTYAAVFLGDVSGTSGKTLTINSANALGISSTNCRVRVYGTNTVCDANLVLNDSIMQFAPYGNTGSQTYNGIISGAGAIINRGSSLSTILAAQNTYTGGTTPSSGAIGVAVDSTGMPVTSGPLGTGPIWLIPEGSSASGSIMASGGARTIGNAIQYGGVSGTVTFGTSGTNPITFTGAFSLQGQDSTGNTNRTVNIANSAVSTFAGVIGDGGLNCGFTKTGSGIMALTATETYTGPTTVSAGTLQVDGTLSSSSLVTVSSGGNLGGTGTVGSPVTVAVGGAIAPGDSAIGTLTVNNYTNAGSLKIEVDRSQTQKSDKIVVNGTAVINGGSIIVTNIGTSALAAGDVFQVFGGAVATGGNITNISGGGTGVAWINSLATNGTIIVDSVASLPAVTTVAASAVTAGGATLNATVTPNGATTGYWFKYGTTASYGSNTAVVAIGAGTTALPESAVVSNLLPNTTYHFAAFATNSIGTNNGVDLTFTTLPIYQVAVTGPTKTGNSFQLSFTNSTGAALTVYATTNVSLPLSQWTSLGRATESPAGSGSYSFTDAQATSAMRFYRLVGP
jgi:autotransporter-associated beta strand protein